jgi:hypothetical protein
MKKLVERDARGKIVFVGDTHGDVNASRKIIKKYLKLGYRIDDAKDSVKISKI